MEQYESLKFQVALLAEELPRPPESFKDALHASLAGHKEELQILIDDHQAHLDEHTEAQRVDFDCHRRETSAVLENLRAELAGQSGEHKEHFTGRLESHRQEHSAVLHGVRAELEAQLAQQFAAVSALVEQYEALKLQVALLAEELPRPPESFKDDLYASLAGHKKEHHRGALGLAGGAYCDAPEFH